MKKTTVASAIALTLALAGGNIAPQIDLGIKPAAAQQKPQAGKSLSEKVGKPIKEAQALIGQKKFKEAIVILQGLDKTEGKAPYESFVTNEYLGDAYFKSGDYASAAREWEDSIATGQMPADQLPPRYKALATLHFASKNYPKAIEWGQKYTKDVQDTEIIVLVGQAQHLQKDYKGASDAVNRALKIAASKNQAPQETWLQLLMSSEYEQKNTAGVQAALEQLVQRYPKPEYWNDLLNVMAKSLRGTGSIKSGLDLNRLMLATGVMKSDAEYSEMAEMALALGLPAEAKKVVEQGYQAGILGQGKEAERHKRLQNKATTDTATDLKALESGAAEAAKQKTGDAEVKFGEAYWSHGQHDKAAELIQRGISRGVKDADDANLRLGMAYLGAGKRAQALEAFKLINPTSPSGQFARLWTYQTAGKQSASAAP